MTGLLVDEGRLVLKDGRWVATSDLSDVPVPPTISALLAARLDKLPARERRLLDIASVMGQVFYPRAVRALAGDGADDVGSGIDDARPHSRSSGASDPTSRRPRRSAFRHLLIRDAAYDAVPKATRAELHERFADWLDASDGSLGSQDEIVGYHLEQAYRYRVELGAESANGSGSCRTGPADASHPRESRRSPAATTTASIGLLSRASALLALDDPLRLGLLSDLGSALVWAGDPDGGRAALDEADPAGRCRRAMSGCAMHAVHPAADIVG